MAVNEKRCANSVHSGLIRFRHANAQHLKIFRMKKKTSTTIENIAFLIIEYGIQIKSLSITGTD